MDGLVRKAFQKARLQVPSPLACLIAVGGYGRAELAPFSDVDLLLLYDSSEKEHLPPFVENILYPLWDIGLDATCSSRSIKECLKMARSDLYIKTGLIDGRFLDGEYELFRKFYDFFSQKVLHCAVRKFAEALAKDLSLRRQKYEDPAYILEPNLKEGEGGLRDFQMGRWLIRAKYKTDRWDSILIPDHSRLLDKSLEFLWALRNQLHLLSGRKQDNLTFEFQEKIAPKLGFLQGTEGVEEMMRQYHLATQRISNFVQDILDRVLHEPSWVKKVFFSFQQKKIDGNFGIADGELHLLAPVTFKKDPTQLMTLFKHCQTYGSQMDFRAEEAVLEALLESHPNNSGLQKAYKNSLELEDKFAEKTKVKYDRKMTKQGRVVLEEVEIDNEDDGKEKTQVKASVEDNKTHVKVELKFLTNSTEPADIAADISDRVAAIKNNISGLIKHIIKLWQYFYNH